MNREKKVTLVDVAEAAGVSRTTASYILRRAGGNFAPDTEARVFQAAKDLGFRPNAIARWLRTGRPRLLGFLTPVDLESAHHIIKHQIEVGIGLEARKHGMDIVKVLLAQDTESETGRISEMLDTGLLDCLILENPPKGSPVIPLLLRKGAHFVVIGNPEHPGVYSVDSDNEALGRAVAEHLIKLGHRGLAYIAPLEQWAWGNDRVRGFLAACCEAGIPESDSLVVRVNHSMTGGYEGMRELLTRHAPITGICAADDQTAYGAMQAIDERGLSVPQNFSVVGCNNDYVLGVFRDLLTTVELESVNLGSMAAAKAISLSEGKSPPLREFCQFHLIHRRSSAAPI